MSSPVAGQNRVTQGLDCTSLSLNSACSRLRNTDFRDSLGLSKNTWQAIFILSILFAAAWVVQSLRYRFGKNVLSVEELIEELKEDSTVQQRPETGALDVVTVPNKVLRDQMPEITRETGPLHIINAEYGTDQHRIPVTEKLNAAINNGRLSIFVGNNIAGDPCPNFPKYLLVSYSVDGKISTRRVAEGILLVLP